MNKIQGGSDDNLKPKDNKHVVFISGIPGSGKSTVAKKFEERGYYLISGDDVIYKHVIPKAKHMFDGLEHKVFGLYHPNKNFKTVRIARDRFIEEVKKLITNSKSNNIVIEGAFLHKRLFEKIFENLDYTFYFVKPKNKKEYIKRIEERFEKQPELYGRMGKLRNLDKDGSALKDFKKNGIHGKMIQGIIHKVADLQYKKMKEWSDLYDEWGLKYKIYKN
jgi:adenylate kinase family enzyme